MKIAFSKVHQAPKHFERECFGVRCEGVLERIDRDRIKLDATFSGSKSLDCDRCAKHYVQQIDHRLEMVLTQKAQSTNDDLDIIEFLDGFIDIDYIVESELCSLESTFHFCEACESSDEILEIEF